MIYDAIEWKGDNLLDVLDFVGSTMVTVQYREDGKHLVIALGDGRTLSARPGDMLLHKGEGQFSVTAKANTEAV